MELSNHTEIFLSLKTRSAAGRAEAIKNALAERGVAAHVCTAIDAGDKMTDLDILAFTTSQIVAVVEDDDNTSLTSIADQLFVGIEAKREKDSFVMLNERQPAEQDSDDSALGGATQKLKHLNARSSSAMIKHTDSTSFDPNVSPIASPKMYPPTIGLTETVENPKMKGVLDQETILACLDKLHSTQSPIHVSEYLSQLVASVSGDENLKQTIFTIDNIHNIVDLMQKYIESNVVQAVACFLFSVLGTDNQCRELIVRADGIASVIRAMTTHFQDEFVQAKGCAAVCVLSALLETNKTEACEQHATSTVLNALKTHIHSSQVLREGCAAICSLAIKHESKEFLINNDAIATIVSAMETHQSDASLQRDACLALCTLCSGNMHAKMQSAARGVIASALSAMQTHPNNCLVLQQACWLLGSLGINDDVKRYIDDEGGIHAIVTALNADKEDVDLQRKGISALTNIAARSDIFAATVLQAGGIVAAKAAMKMHSKNITVQDTVLRCFRNVSPVVGCKEILVSGNGIGVIVSTMETHMLVATIQENGCWLLKSLAAGNPVNQAAIANGGIKAVLCAIETHSYNEGVVGEACQCLCNTLCNTDCKCAFLAKRDALATLINAMQAHLGSAPLQAHACGALASMARIQSQSAQDITTTSSDKLMMKSSGDGLFVGAPNNVRSASQAIIRSMKMHSKSPIVQAKACWALCNLAATSPAVTDILASSGAIGCVLGAMHTHSNDASVQADGCGFLYNIGLHTKHRSMLKANKAIGAVQVAKESHPNNKTVQSRAADVTKLLLN
eukprot:gene1988-5068_t